MMRRLSQYWWVIGLLVLWRGLLEGVTLQWDPVTYTEPVGYRLYWGVRLGEYHTVIDVGAATTQTLDVPSPAAFVVTAYGTVNGQESPYSTAVQFGEALRPDTTAPTVAITSPTRGATVVPDLEFQHNSGVDVTVFQGYSAAFLSTVTSTIQGLFAVNQARRGQAGKGLKIVWVAPTSQGEVLHTNALVSVEEL